MAQEPLTGNKYQDTLTAKDREIARLTAEVERLEASKIYDNWVSAMDRIAELEAENKTLGDALAESLPHQQLHDLRAQNWALRESRVILQVRIRELEVSEQNLRKVLAENCITGISKDGTIEVHQCDLCGFAWHRASPPKHDDDCPLSGHTAVSCPDCENLRKERVLIYDKLRWLASGCVLGDDREMMLEAINEILGIVDPHTPDNAASPVVSDKAVPAECAKNTNPMVEKVRREFARDMLFNGESEQATYHDNGHAFSWEKFTRAYLEQAIASQPLPRETEGEA